MLDFQAARWLVAQDVAKQAGNDHPTSIPTGVFKTTDGHINIATTGGAIWERFCKALGADAMLKNPDYASSKIALGEPQGAQRRDRHLHPAQVQRRVDRHLRQGRRAGRSDLQHRPGVRRSAGQASRHRAEREEEGQVDAQRWSASRSSMSRTKSKIAAPPPGLGQHTDEVLKEFGFKPRKSPRCAKPRRSDARTKFEETAMTQAAAVATPQAEKMLSRKEGSVGYVIFNNPGAPQRRLARHVAGGRRDARRLPQRQQHQGGGGDRRRRQGLRVRRRHLALREGALQRGRGEALQRGRGQELPRLPRVPEARHRHDPRLLHRRRHGARHLLRHPHRHREVDLRGAGGQARPGLRLYRAEAAGRRGRAVVRHGDFLHGAAIHRSRGARPWAS